MTAPPRTYPDGKPPAGSPSQPPRVAILFDPGRWRFRGAMRGISRLAAEQGGWDMMLLLYHHWPLPVENLRDQADGVLCGGSEISQRYVKALDLPTVSLVLHPALMEYTPVAPNYTRAGELAAEEFTSRGLRNLCVFTTGEDYRLDAQEVVEGFTKRAAREGRECPVFVIGPRTRARKRWLLEDQLADLSEWLRELEKPLGLLAADDEHAWRAVRACKLAGLAVPDDVSIIGVGDDEYLCESCTPALTSVAFDHERAGYLAAAMLAERMAGRWPPPPPRLEPIGVINRSSTDLIAVEDPVVREALAYIRGNTEVKPAVADVAGHVKVSPRTLHRRFLEATGRTPGDEIHRRRLERARRLITATGMQLADIAVRSGFTSVSQLSRDIYRHTGLRPTELRAGKKT